MKLCLCNVFQGCFLLLLLLPVFSFSKDGVAAAKFQLNSIDLAFPVDDRGDKRWFNQSRRSYHWLENSKSLAVLLLESGHDYLKLDTANRKSRLIYLLTVGQLEFRLQYANSVIIHELGHCTSFYQQGRSDCGFSKDNNANVRVSWETVYTNLFTTFLPQAGVRAYIRPELESTLTGNELLEQEIISDGIGVNIQTWISEKSAIDLFFQDQSFFSASHYLVNRFFLSGYALYDGNSNYRGDVYQYTRDFNRRTGENLSANTVASISLASALLSPATWSYARGYADYVVTAERGIKASPLHITGYKIYWDIPNYLNARNYSVAPRFFIRPNSSGRIWLGINKLMLGFGFEHGVYGEQETEATFFMRGQRNRWTLGTDLAAGADGMYVEIVLLHDWHNKFDFRIGMATVEGTTLRGQRLLPFGESSIWFGIGFTP